MNGIDDASILANVTASNTEEILYRAKRLLQVNPGDPRAVAQIRSLKLSRIQQNTEHDIFGELLANTKARESLLQAAVLIEREDDAFLCRRGDDGSTMFLILRGFLKGYMDRSPDLEEDNPNFFKVPGALVGDLAFALRQPRTATLVCSGQVALLAFSYEDLRRAALGSPHEEMILRSLEYTVNLKILEMVCNRKRFLTGESGDGPLSGPDHVAPWLDLQPFARIHDVSWQDKKLMKDIMLGGSAGLCILVSGTVRDTDGRVLDGRDCPIIFAHSNERDLNTPGEVQLEADAKILAIGEEGFHSFGKKIFDSIIALAEADLLDSGAHRTLGAGQGLAGQRFFVSYNATDLQMANWIAWTLKEHGHEVAVHDWEIPAGESIPNWMDQRLAWADRLIAVLSPSYMLANFSTMEWTSSLWNDPSGARGAVIPVLVDPTTRLPALLNALKRIDLRGVDEPEARRRLLDGVALPQPPARQPAFVPAASDPSAGPPDEKPDFPDVRLTRDPGD